MSARSFRKSGRPEAVQWEAAGLRWLADAARGRDGSGGGGAPVVEIIRADRDELVLEHLDQVSPSEADAFAFGAALARTHAAGAPGWGVGPDGWEGHGLQGPAGDQLPLPLATPGEFSSWGEMWADLRLAPLNEKARIPEVDAVCDRLRAGVFDDDGELPARVHGDLWAGNVMWTAAGGVLIDPTPYGGHPLDDLAALHLFGAPHGEHIVAGYQSVHPLAETWRSRIGLHQLHLLLLHVVLFGGSYRGQTVRAAESALALG